jgi:hypothetical protein
MTVEWLWDTGSIRADTPEGREIRREGAHAEVVALLNELGAEGWRVLTSTAQGNWIFWTLGRELDVGGW